MIVSVVVPMKDEEGSLPLLAVELDGLRGALAARSADLEVVLVDDGSVDATGPRARDLAASRRGWTIVTHQVNRGFGAGFRSGLAAATGDVIVSYDADCAYPAADVLRLLDALDAGADVAGATPFAAGGAAAGSGLRLLISRSCSLAYRLVLGGRARGLHTFTCAFRAYRADVLRGVDWRADGFLAAAEIVSGCLRQGARVVEVPSSLRPRVAGASKMKIVRTTWAHLGLLTRLAVQRGRARGAARAASRVTVGEAA